MTDVYNISALFTFGSSLFLEPREHLSQKLTHYYLISLYVAKKCNEGLLMGNKSGILTVIICTLVKPQRAARLLIISEYKASSVLKVISLL